MELLDIVNEADDVVGVASYDDAYARKLPHRIVHVLILNTKGEMALQLRSRHKSFCPGHWSTAVGGHVQAGETYVQAALREFQEELGVQAALTSLGKIRYITPTGVAKFVTTFTATFDRPFIINPEEVERVAFFPRSEIVAMVRRGEPFHPELLVLLNSHFASDFESDTVRA